MSNDVSMYFLICFNLKSALISSRTERLTEVGGLSPCDNVPPQYLHLLIRFNRYTIHYKLPFAFSIFLYPLGHCLVLRRFYSTKFNQIQRNLRPLRTYWAYHVLQFEPDNLAPVYTPEESERRTMGKRTSWLHLLTFCQQRVCLF